ncbi:DUF3368 domain-containing protein [Salinadaptatus halalkaliphilus]|uniref:DUF3368 domain-containing protein n=1 Tax=Salinadaptatus halalkaliphilus TaxID=2419781 RepID=A0A4S3TQX2_9EURY|nr:DUF3368 domain-containing protein [Salinadaptatus halalkaliphilus]THE65713.1 DUF3368 domain-containing protein [Salinadaptatus halalkaliphilus]
MWVFDATALIYLAKVEQLRLVSTFEGCCCIPDLVYEEVVTTGLEAGYPDARRIEQSVEDGRFDLVSVDDSPLADRLRGNPTVSDADVTALTCAASNEGVAVMDETAGRRVADIEDIETRGTAYLVVLCAKRGAIAPDTARETIDAMIDAGWYCAPDVYTTIVRKPESFED